MSSQFALGEIHIADHVVARIAAAAAAKVPGIVFAGKQAQRKVLVQVDGSMTNIEMGITVRYGTIIQDACRTLQRAVTETVHALTGLEVKTVDVKVDHIAL